MLPLACLLILLVLKYEFTRLLKVLENSEARFWANFGLLILVLFNVYCLNTEVTKTWNILNGFTKVKKTKLFYMANVHLFIQRTSQ